MNLERGVAKMPEIAECGNAKEDNTMENAEMLEYNGGEYNTMEKPKCQKRQYNAEVTPSNVPSLVLSNPNSILENARKA